MAAACLMEGKLDVVTEHLSQSIADKFVVLANLHPKQALYLLEQLSEKVNKDNVEEALVLRDEQINALIPTLAFDKEELLDIIEEL